MNHHLGIHPLAPDAARSARVREACRKKLATMNERRTSVETMIVGAFSILYVLAIVHDTLVLSMS